MDEQLIAALPLVALDPPLTANKRPNLDSNISTLVNAFEKKIS